MNTEVLRCSENSYPFQPKRDSLLSVARHNAVSLTGMRPSLRYPDIHHTSLRTGLFGERGALINQGPTRGKRQTLFIDRVHLLLGLVEAGENILPWLDRFRGETPQIRAALEYVEGRSRSLAPACRKVLGLLEVGPLFKGVA